MTDPTHLGNQDQDSRLNQDSGEEQRLQPRHQQPRHQQQQHQHQQHQHHHHPPHLAAAAEQHLRSSFLLLPRSANDRSGAANGGNTPSLAGLHTLTPAFALLPAWPAGGTAPVESLMMASPHGTSTLDGTTWDKLLGPSVSAGHVDLLRIVDKVLRVVQDEDGDVHVVSSDPSTEASSRTE